MKNNRYEDSDFVEVVDEAGTAQADRIPKQWIGTDLAPGVKQASKAAKSSDGPSPDSVEGILASVGDDKEKAQAALDAEKAKDSPRSTLVTKLEAIVGSDS